MESNKKLSTKKRLAFLMSGALALAVMAGTWAFFSSTTTIKNPLETDKYGNETEETFSPKDDWQPGDEVEKTVGVTNTGDYDLLVRIKMSEIWTLANNDTVSFASAVNAFHSANATSAVQGSKTDGLVAGDESVVYKKLTASGWVFGNDGYWYYTSKLTPNASTGKLLESITLAADTDMGKNATSSYYTTMSVKPAYSNYNDNPSLGWALFAGDEVPDEATHVRAVSSIDEDATGYAGAKYVLTITTETLQATRAAFEGTSSWSDNAPTVAKNGWGFIN